MIALDRVSVRLAGRAALSEVSLRFACGEIVGVIGPPEAGKTVLVKTIAALCDPVEGEMIADGARVDRLDSTARAAWQARIGMAFQNDALFDTMSVFENVAFPLRRRRVPEAQVRLRVEQRLEDVGLAEAQGKLPSELSGGMRKRVGVARATVIEPAVGLFDDPIAGLDPMSAARILDLIVALTRRLNMATIVVSNDLPVLLPICSRTVMLCAGRVVYDGAASELSRATRPEVVQFVTGADEGPL